MTSGVAMVRFPEKSGDPVRFGTHSSKTSGSLSQTTNNTSWEACMKKKKTQIILIIYLYDEETDIVSAIVRVIFI